METNQTLKNNMADTPLVSVIVPVCNVEDYLRGCLKTLREQTLKEIEFLLVNDGSKDSCPQILEEETKGDPRMIVINKPNGGYGSAINAGLKRARGLYVGIVEPDDFIDPHMYEDLLGAVSYSKTGQPDVIKSSYWEYYDVPGEDPYMKAPNLMNCMPKMPFAANVKDEFEVLFHHPSVWSAIYRRQFLEEHDIKMMEVPGGGWVDNPFFYETLLQAREFVWIPAAYYYYRQTNPNSSSNMKNYRLPYDRLRDIRALFERLKVTDPQIKACMYARHFFYTFSVIGEWGFSEKDPEIRKLINEAMSALDKKILYGGYRGIPPKYLTYYESIMEDPAKHARAKKASSSPQIGVIVPMCNDRFEISNTLNSLSVQETSDMEVICADAGSKDISYEIASSFAQKDQRIRTFEAEGYGRAAAVRAAMEKLQAPCFIILLPGQKVSSSYLKEALSASRESTDMAIMLSKQKRNYMVSESDTVVPIKNAEGKLLLAAFENIAGCVFKTDFLKEKNITIRPEDEKLLMFLLEAITACGKISLCFCDVPKAAVWNKIFISEDGKTDQEVYEENKKDLENAFELSKSLGKGAQSAFRTLAVRRLLDDLRTFICADQGKEIFAELKEAFSCRYGLLDVPRSSYCNTEAFLALEQDLTSPYEKTLKKGMEMARASSNKLKAQRMSLENSRSYRLAYAALQKLRSIKRRLGGKK